MCIETISLPLKPINQLAQATFIVSGQMGASRGSEAQMISRVFPIRTIYENAEIRQLYRCVLLFTNNGFRWLFSKFDAS